MLAVTAVSRRQCVCCAGAALEKSHVRERAENSDEARGSPSYSFGSGAGERAGEELQGDGPCGCGDGWCRLEEVHTEEEEDKNGKPVGP